MNEKYRPSVKAGAICGLIGFVILCGYVALQHMIHGSNPPLELPEYLHVVIFIVFAFLMIANSLLAGVLAYRMISAPLWSRGKAVKIGAAAGLTLMGVELALFSLKTILFMLYFALSDTAHCAIAGHPTVGFDLAFAGFLLLLVVPSGVMKMLWASMGTLGYGMIRGEI